MDVTRFASRRFRRAPGHWLLGALGLSAAIGGVLVALVAPVIAGDVALRRELEAGTAADRTVTVVSTDGPKGSDPSVDNYVRGLLGDRGLVDTVRLTLFGQLATGNGDIFRIVGVDDLARLVSLDSGTLPTRCDADRCEAVIWRRPGAPESVELDDSLHVSVVGTVSREDDRLLSGTFKPEDREAVLFVDGAASPARIDALTPVDRSTGWIATVDPRRMSVSRVPAFLRDLATLGQRNDVANLVVTGPVQTLDEVTRRARITVHRMALPVGQAGAMLAGFAVVTTFAVRPWHRRGLRILQLRSSTMGEEWRFALVEALLLVMIGALVGVAVGVVGTASVAAAAHVDIRAAIRLLGQWRVVGPFCVLIAAGFGGTVAMLHAPHSDERPRRLLRLSDGIGLAAVGVWVVASQRGVTTAETLANGADPLLSITPALACIAAACIAVRVLPLLGAVLRRLVPARAWVARLAVGDSAGHRRRSVLTAAFVTASITMATFALGYRTTLQTGSADQAAFAVPLDLTLREGPKLVSPQSVRPPAVWSQTAGIFATNVLRRSVGLRRSGTAADSVEAIGIDPRALDELHTWRGDFGPRPAPAAIATSAPEETGVSIPAGAAHITMTSTPLPPGVELGLVLERADGSWHESIATPDDSGTRWTTELNPFEHDVRVEGFRIGNLHDSAAGPSQVATAIDVVLTGVTSDGGPLSIDWSQMSSTQAQLAIASAPTSGLRITSSVHGTTNLVLTGRSQAVVLPAIVDPLTAATATDGVVTLEVPNGGTLRVRVAVVDSAFPTTGARFVVVDQAAMSSALDRIQPGTGAPTEMWLAARGAPARRALYSAVASRAFAILDHSVRTELEAQLSGDTLGRSVMMAFLVASLAAALLGAMALVFAANSDRLDEIDVLRALRSSGATSGQLSRLQRTRCLMVIAASVPIGVVCGLVLLAAVRDSLSVGATGTAPVPALRTVVAPAMILALAAGMTVISLLGAEVSNRSTRSIARHDSFSARP